MNILTFDVEEWFHLLDFDATRTEAEWGKYEVRIHENVERIFHILEETDTKATFFVIGWVAKTYPELVRRIADRYQIGCHTMNHQLVWQQSPAEFRADVETGVKMLEDITGKKVVLFRPPYGDYNDRLIKTCEKGGFYAIQWDVDSLDWKDISARDISKRIIERTKSGSIILCHNNALNTLEALPEIFANLIGRGYEFVGISDLIYTENFKVDANARHRPSENS